MADIAWRATERHPHHVTDDLMDLLRTFGRGFFDPYHPERHYMRGPGPKWHAKHDRGAPEDGPSPSR